VAWFARLLRTLICAPQALTGLLRLFLSSPPAEARLKAGRRKNINIESIFLILKCSSKALGALTPRAEKLILSKLILCETPFESLPGERRGSGKYVFRAQNEQVGGQSWPCRAPVFRRHLRDALCRGVRAR